MSGRSQIQARRAAGFTLVEIALAMLVVAIGMMGLLAVLPVGLQSSRDAADDSRVALLAHTVLSDLRMEMRQNWAGGAAGYRYEYVTDAGTVTLQNGGAEVLFNDDGGYAPIGRFRLEAKDFDSDIIEAMLVCKPGVEGSRELVYYTRIIRTQ